MTTTRRDDKRGHPPQCDCCGKDADEAAPVEFSTGFRFYLLTPDDPGAAPSGRETVHAATNSSGTARHMLNLLAADGVRASGWDNERGTWFLTPEIMEAMRRPAGELPARQRR